MRDDLEIVFANRGMIPELKELWIEAFSDDREYVDFYFANRFTEDNMLVITVQGRPVSMISLLPAYLHCGQGRVRARYVYAVATKKKYRRLGYAGKLLREGYERIAEPFFLEPADAHLAAYYKKNGFFHAFGIREYEPKANESEEGIIRAAEITASAGREKEKQYWLLTVTPEEYKRIRDGCFCGSGYVEWDKEAIAYALIENDFCGGFAYKVVHDHTEDLLLFRMEDETLRIIETTLKDEDVLGVLSKLRLNPDRVIVRRPAKTNGSSFAMLYGNYKIKNGYLNLTLD